MVERSLKERYIFLVKGKGKGNTQLSAFDAALYDARISNFNLIYLSSIIPENSKIIFKKIKFREEDYGKKLYVVLAKKIETKKGKYAFAGLGWVQNKEGRGLFVEDTADNKKELKKLITLSLKDLIKRRKEYKYGKINYLISGIKCKGKPVCAICAAIYQIEDFK
ncbi:MAG: pyruvoyl-dependent arginine decarboxylase [Minisyncoccia bacterium]